MNTTKRRRWPLIALTALLTVGVIVVATEAVVRSIVPNRVADELRTALNLSNDHQITVETSGLLTPQVIAGRFYTVAVSAEDVPITGGIRASLRLHARDMPLKPTEHELGQTEVTATFTEAQLASVLKELSKGIGQELTIEKDHLTVSNSLPFFGQSIPITITFAPSVVDGQLHIAPIAVDAAGLMTLSVDQLPDYKIFEPIANGANICVDSFLPEGVTLTGLSLSSTRTLTVTVDLNPRLGIDPSLQDLGEC